jgi:hypothetical protein
VSFAISEAFTDLVGRAQNISGGAIGWDGQQAVSGGPNGCSFLLQALPNGAPTSSKPSSPALIETKEPNGSAPARGSTTDEPEEQEVQVGVGQGV